MFDPINLKLQKDRYNKIGSGISFFSSSLRAYESFNTSMENSVQQELQNQTALTLKTLDDLEGASDMQQKAMNLDRVLASQNAYFAASGISGGTANALRNADVSSFIRDANLDAVGNRVKDVMSQQQQALGKMKASKLREDALWNSGAIFFDGVLSLLLGGKK